MCIRDCLPAARDVLARAGFDPNFGARPLRRALQQQVEDALSEEILAGRFQPGDHILVDAEGEQIVFRRAESLPLPSMEGSQKENLPVAEAPKV